MISRSPKARKKRSPLKDRPLRYPGQSLDDQIEDKLFDSITDFTIAMLFVILAFTEWWRTVRHDTFHPILYGVIATIALLICAWRIRRRFKLVHFLKLGRDGERIVAEHLEQLAKFGYTTLHDIVGGDFNVDHVLIGPGGIFAIETKTRSKSGGVEETVVFDGAEIYIHGKPINPNPLSQAKANARWLKELLKDSTGRNFSVGAVVLFPGWYVEQKSKPGDATVLNPKYLEACLKNKPPVLSLEDASLAAFHLKRFIRR